MNAMDTSTLQRLVSVSAKDERPAIDKFISEARAGSILQLEWLVIVCIEDIQPNLYSAGVDRASTDGDWTEIDGQRVENLKGEH